MGGPQPIRECDAVRVTRPLPCLGLKPGDGGAVVCCPEGFDVVEVEMPLEYPNTDPLRTKLVIVPVDALEVEWSPHTCEEQK